jgi:hypothetical protein
MMGLLFPQEAPMSFFDRHKLKKKAWQTIRDSQRANPSFAERILLFTLLLIVVAIVLAQLL